MCGTDSVQVRYMCETDSVRTVCRYMCETDSVQVHVCDGQCAALSVLCSVSVSMHTQMH
jgi:hypothetical protein